MWECRDGGSGRPQNKEWRWWLVSGVQSRSEDQWLKNLLNSDAPQAYRHRYSFM